MYLRVSCSAFLLHSHSLFFYSVCVCVFFGSRRICFCPLGFPKSLGTAKAKDGFLEEVRRVEEFLRDPWGFRVSEEKGTVQVPVPRVVQPPPPPPHQQPLVPVVADGVADDEAALAMSAQNKRAALQRRAAAAMVAAEDYARRFESGDLAVRFVFFFFFFSKLGLKFSW